MAPHSNQRFPSKPILSLQTEPAHTNCEWTTWGGSFWPNDAHIATIFHCDRTENVSKMVHYPPSVVAVVLGERSGLPVPKLAFKFSKTAWYEEPSFIESLADQQPTAIPSYPENATPKEREKYLVAALDLSADKKDLEQWNVELKQKLKHFWQVVGNEMVRKGADARILEKTRARVRKCIKKRRDAEWRQFYGLVNRGKVAVGREDCFYPFQSAVMRELPNPVLSFVPPVVKKTIPSKHVERLRDLESKLEVVLRIRGGYNRDARDSNYGYSLGRTTVTGGTHSDKSKGVSGSVHMNQTLTGMSKSKKNECAKEGVDVDSLQTELISAITELIVDSFGAAPWFKAAMDKLRRIPSRRMLPGEKLPSSHIWWTCNPEAYHVHTDTNTVPPAFLICVSKCRGGELVCLPPTGGPTVIDTSTPTIIGGSWAQYPHCNLPVLQGVRHSYVVYTDHRNLAESYADKIK